ncbi:hypothetical protein ACJ73_09774 [Blastomyces percursus]|uniref:Uncharacterized protein n=1 Tax=Blastomyces percursus TaxID=1658174 RepID=A0A1J9P2A5_9EURO|nr:hypothetical protein ACJ73_09774 [Blastomyces percursus]
MARKKASSAPSRESSLPKIKSTKPGERSDRSHPGRNSQPPPHHDKNFDTHTQDTLQIKPGMQRSAPGSLARANPAKQAKNHSAEDDKIGPNNPTPTLPIVTTVLSSNSDPTPPSHGQDTPNQKQKTTGGGLDSSDLEMAGTENPTPPNDQLSWAEQVEHEEQKRTESDQNNDALEGGDSRVRAKVTHEEKHKVITETRELNPQQTGNLPANLLQPKTGLPTADRTPAEKATEKDAAPTNTEAAPQAARKSRRQAALDRRADLEALYRDPPSACPKCKGRHWLRYCPDKKVRPPNAAETPDANTAQKQQKTATPVANKRKNKLSAKAKKAKKAKKLSPNKKYTKAELEKAQRSFELANILMDGRSV